ncbi:MAG: corrinoid protein [Clostridia bacterium]|nr:corrinoid protein [Clostridia bacterium]
MVQFEEIQKLVETGKAKDLRDAVHTALEQGCDPLEVLEKGLLPGMNEISKQFRNEEVYVPEVLMAVRAMNIALSLIRSRLLCSELPSPGTAVVGTVRGDLHDVGKNLVKMLLEGKGITVIDLGIDVPAERFIEAAKEYGAQLICCSALLTTTMGEMARIVECAKEAGIRDQVCILVGGAPITEEFCEKIGADCYTPDAASAAEEAYAYLMRLREENNGTES